MTSFAEEQAAARTATIIQMARETSSALEGCEIDDDPSIAEGDDNGCYVQAWVWVDFAGTPLDKG